MEEWVDRYKFVQFSPDTQVFAVNGGAGAGKTSWLLDRLEEELKTVPASRIAYVSFTRKGAYQGVDRAKEQFDIPPEECKYFKTIHAIGFHEKSAKDTMMSFRDYNKIYKALGFSATRGNMLRDEIGIAIGKVGFKRTETGMVLRGTNRNENTYIERWGQIGVTLQKDMLKLWDVLNLYKEKFGKTDFSDLIQHVKPLDIDVAFIDEAQDLTLPQWVCVQRLFKLVKRVYIAGDINQSVMRFAGADPLILWWLYKQKTVKVTYLEDSHRCPKEICDAAAYVLTSCWGDMYRVAPVKSNRKGGFVVKVERMNIKYLISMMRQLHHFCKKGYTLYVLAHTTYRAQVLNYVLTLSGIPHLQDVGNDKLTHALDHNMMKIAQKVNRLMRGKTTEEEFPSSVADLFYHSLPCTKVKAGKGSLKLRLKKPLTEYPESVQASTMRAWQELIYQHTQDPMEQQGWLNTMRTGACHVPAERVLVATVPRVKGGEADFVFYDATHTVNIKDDWGYHGYTALTRAKKGVVVMCAQASGNTVVKPGEIFRSIHETGTPCVMTRQTDNNTEILAYEQENLWKQLEPSVFDISQKSYVQRLLRARQAARLNSRITRRRNGNRESEGDSSDAPVARRKPQVYGR